MLRHLHLKLARSLQPVSSGAAWKQGIELVALPSLGRPFTFTADLRSSVHLIDASGVTCSLQSFHYLPSTFPTHTKSTGAKSRLTATYDVQTRAQATGSLLNRITSATRPDTARAPLPLYRTPGRSPRAVRRHYATESLPPPTHET